MVVTVGICCMDVKLYSRPMTAILNRLRRYDDITIVPFGNRCIFEMPVELWPIVDFLICFYSAGFPIDKAQEYVRLRDPLCFNNVLSQHLLLDRTVVYKMLQANGIPVPRYRVFQRPLAGAIAPQPSEDSLTGSSVFPEMVLPVVSLPNAPLPPGAQAPPPAPTSGLDSSAGSASSEAAGTAAGTGAATTAETISSSKAKTLMSPTTVPPVTVPPPPGSTHVPPPSPLLSGQPSGPHPVPVVDPITASQTQGERLQRSSSHVVTGQQAADFERYKKMLLDMKNDDALDEAVMMGTGPGAVDPETIDAQRREMYWGSDDPIQENEDSICVKGEKFKKPFVEKPVWAEDHNIYVYYPKSSGGGSKRLFRKVRDRSSKFFPTISTVRREGSYIYEDFITTDGMDVKVYTVGPDYAHAEARKAPTVDGRVMRTEDGKEVRYHVILNQVEKEIARKITQIFGQNICGFDLLRTDSMSYVCDVNGFSFVKGSPKYYNDCAQIIYEMIQFHLHPVGLSRASRLVQDNDERLESAPPSDPRKRELRCVLAVIRHGDRTPKQKVKVKVTHPLILKFFEGHDPKRQVKFKSVKEMQEFSAAISQIVAEMADGGSDVAPPSPVGITSFPPSPLLNRQATSAAAAPPTSPATGSLQRSTSSTMPRYWMNPHKALLEIKEALDETSYFSGINRKVQIKPLKWVFEDGDETKVKVTQALLIFKYGGQLTELGFKQADWLGKTFRQNLYPPSARGGPSLHSSFAHDIKFYASDEGRVQMTAAMFAKAFLELDEEEIVPILYALVWNDDRAISWLDCSISSSTTFINEKRRIAEILNADVDFSESNKGLDPTLLFGGITVEDLRKMGAGKLGNPRKRLEVVRDAIKSLITELEPRAQRVSRPCSCDIPTDSTDNDDYSKLCESEEDGAKKGIAVKTDEETCGLTASSPRSTSKIVVQYDSRIARTLKMWKKLLRVFYNDEAGRFDTSKISDIVDCAMYHMLHFRAITPSFRTVYDAVLPLAQWMVPHEYGITQGSKNAIAEQVVRPLVNKLLADLRQPRDMRQLQTVSRFYFTSESHMNTLHNLLEYRFARKISGSRYEEYISHFVIKLYENTGVPVNDPSRFVVEVWHSSGSKTSSIQDSLRNMNNSVYPLKHYVTRTLDDFIKALE